MSEENMTSTIAKIYIENLRHNLKLIKGRISPGAKMCVAIKADAYGHGALRCAREAVLCGADFLAVARVREGVELREGGITIPLLMLSLCNPEEADELVLNEITPLVFDFDYIKMIEDAARKAGKKKYSVHLAVDTGMGRIGCLPEECVRFAKYIDESEFLSLGGVCTHFSVADSKKETDREYTEKQFERFVFATESIRKAGINPGIRHCANSAITLDKPEMHLDMCRPGIIVYGYYPDELDRDYFSSKGEQIDLKPVMALTTRVVSIRDFEPGKSVSYGRTWTSEKKTKIAVLPIGYADGFFRRFSKSCGFCEGIDVAINGRPYPIRGRICMDQCMVELGETSGVERWSEAVIFGPKESGAVQTAQKLADETGTIPYEITCGVGKRVPRVFVE